MPFVITKDGATIPSDGGMRNSLRTEGKEVSIIKSSVYSKGELLADEQVSQFVKDKYVDGDERILGLIEEISQEEYDKGVTVEIDGAVKRWKLVEGEAPLFTSSKIDEPVTRIESDKALVANAIK
jgi:hypothetical protein